MHDAEPRAEALSIQRVAVIIGVHPDTIRNWIRTGDLEAVRVGPRLIRIPRSEVARLRANRVQK